MILTDRSEGAGEVGEGGRSGSPIAGFGGDLRRRVADGGGPHRRRRPANGARLGFNADGPAGLISGKAPGNRTKLGAAQRRALAEIVASGPIPAVHGLVRWRLIDLAQWIWEEFGLSLSETTVEPGAEGAGVRATVSTTTSTARTERRDC